MRRSGVACLLAVALLILPHLSFPASMLAQSDNPLARGWQHVLLNAPVGLTQGQGPTRIVTGGPGLLAFEPGHPGVPTALWSSADGRTWQPVGLPAFQPDESPIQFYAVGRLYIITGFSNTGTNVSHIWASDDEGATWQESVDRLAIRVLAAGGDGLIAFSQTDTAPATSEVWTSVDGLTWRPVPQATGVFASAMVSSVVRTSQGLVAGGSVVSSSGTEAAIWTSPDGHTWTQAPNGGGIFGNGSDGSGVIQVVAGPRGVLALGEKVEGTIPEQVTWASPDGVHWREAMTPFFDSNEGFGHAVAWEGGFVQFNDEAGEAVLWSSTDGLTWTRLGSDELFGGTAHMFSTAAFQGGVAAVGSFVLHPGPACIKTEGAPFDDLRTFQPAVFVWSPSGAETSPPPTVDPSDPRLLKLLPSDIFANPDSYSTSFGPGTASSAYVNLCAVDPALGLHRAYRLGFADPNAAYSLGAEAISIVTETSSAARVGFRHVVRLLAPVDGIVQHKQTLKAGVRIGTETRVFQVRLLITAEGTQFSATQFAVAWRKGRVIGVIRAGDRYEAAQFAQRQLAHLEHP